VVRIVGDDGGETRGARRIFLEIASGNKIVIAAVLGLLTRPLLAWRRGFE